MTQRQPWIGFFLVVLLGMVTASAARGDIAVTGSTGSGILYGMAHEFVYSTSAFNGNSYTVSELDWDIKPLLYAQARIELTTLAGFTASLDARLGVPLGAGSIGDSDWLNYDVNGDPSKTNYSQHDCYVERALLLDARAGWEIPLAPGVSLVPYLSFGFMDFKWTARDGYLLYPPGYGTTASPPYPPLSSDTPVPASGTGIIYEQTYFIPAAGAEARFRAGNRLRGAVSFTVSPFVFCNDVDNHLFANKNFYDTLSNGLLLEPRVSVEWLVTRTSRLSLDVSYRHIAGLIGNTTVVLTGPTKTPGLVNGTYTNGAGASFETLSAAVSYSFAFASP